MKKITRTVRKTNYEIGVYNTEKREVETYTVDSSLSFKEIEKIARKKLSTQLGYGFVYCKAVGHTDVLYEMSLDDFMKNATISTKNQKEED